MAPRRHRAPIRSPLSPTQPGSPPTRPPPSLETLPAGRRRGGGVGEATVSQGAQRDGASRYRRGSHSSALKGSAPGTTTTLAPSSRPPLQGGGEGAGAVRPPTHQAHSGTARRATAEAATVAPSRDRRQARRTHSPHPRDPPCRAAERGRGRRGHTDSPRARRDGASRNRRGSHSSAHQGIDGRRDAHTHPMLETLPAGRGRRGGVDPPVPAAQPGDCPTGRARVMTRHRDAVVARPHGRLEDVRQWGALGGVQPNALHCHKQHRGARACYRGWRTVTRLTHDHQLTTLSV